MAKTDKTQPVENQAEAAKPARPVKRPKASTARDKKEPKAAQHSAEASVANTTASAKAMAKKPAAKKTTPEQKIPKVSKKPKATPGKDQAPAPVSEPERPSANAAPQPARGRRKIYRSILAIFVLALIGAAGYGYFMQRTITLAEAKTADQRLIAEVGARTPLPPGEVPAVSTVVDETRVNQEFLRGTKKGDKVLLYFQAGKAVVYRPSSGQIINMGPLKTPNPRVFIRSGAKDADVSKVAAMITASNQFTVDSRDNSSKTYARTVVVDVAGNRPDIAAKLAGVLKATVASLPEGESRPDADVLVLVGADFKQR
ncbi:MAG TPA: hypothetical protein VK978_03235 [Candidatus Saccharimonadales bacterium]|nr:hypothetical protein [Candidatus Saccharimonadales bacterium]